jgi:DNA-binding NtrC family response regulator
MVDCASRVDAPAMISGESASKHQRLARLIHRSSARGTRRFAAVTCDGLPETVIESKLFGRAGGSPVGPETNGRGVLEAAAGGTVFLDGIDKASPRLQERLFQFLQDGEVRRVGEDRPAARVDVRLLTGTTEDLQRAVTAGLFREDLFYRLNVLHIVLQ